MILRVARVGRIFAVAAFAALTACSGAGTSVGSFDRATTDASASTLVRPPVPDAVQLLDIWHSHAMPPVKSFVAQPGATGQLIYGCDFAREGCFWFVKGRDKLAGSIGGFNGPQGIGVAPVTGDLYIANSGGSDIRVYAPNSTTLIADFPDPGQVPVDVVAGAGDVIYVANAFTTANGPGSITVMDGSTGNILAKLTDPNVSQGVSVSLDENRLVSFCFIKKDNTGECDAFPDRRGHGVPIASGWGFTGGSSFDNAENLAVINGSNEQLLTFAGSTLCGTATFDGSGDPVWMALDRANHLVYTGDVVNADIDAFPFTDCANGTLHPVKTYENGIGGSDIMSVAVTPGARP